MAARLLQMAARLLLMASTVTNGTMEVKLKVFLTNKKVAYTSVHDENAVLAQLVVKPVSK